MGWPDFFHRGWKEGGHAGGWIPEVGHNILCGSHLPLLGREAEYLPTQDREGLLDQGEHGLWVVGRLPHQLLGVLLLLDEGFVDGHAVGGGWDRLKKRSCHTSTST